jgi:hypothetical protein
MDPDFNHGRCFIIRVLREASTKIHPGVGHSFGYMVFLI